MNIEQFDHPRLASEIQKCFSKREIEELARSSKFIQRSTSRLSGMDFILMNVFDSSNGKERSLSECCIWLEENRGVELKKQSLDERYNTDSVRFMRMCLSRVIEMINGDFMEGKSKTSFNGIFLTDSTSFRIPDPLSNFYEGGGSKSGDAMIKIHLSYNLLDGKVKDLGIRSGKEADGTYLSTLENTITEGGLYIRDLGYYSLSHYKLISKNQAYFLSRGKADAVYTIKTEKGFERVNFLDLLPKGNNKIEHEDIYVGGRKTKLRCRLVIESVPQEVVAKRLKKLARLNSKHTKWNISDMRKKMCHYNVYITNATKEQLPTKTVRIMYKLRWQIELVFKIWKSVFDIDKVKKMSIFRFECYLYSKLIAIFLTLHIQNRFSNYLWEAYEFETSPIKAAKLIKKKNDALMSVLLDTKNKFKKWLKTIMNLLVRRAMKNVRKLKGKPPELTSWQIIKLLA